MKNIKFFAACILVIAAAYFGHQLMSENSAEKQEKSRTEIRQANRATYEACKEDFIKCVALVEDFHEKPYHDRAARYTIGYGSTIYPNGKRVHRRDKKISKSYAQTMVYGHCDQHIWPWLDKYVTVELSKEQMLGTMLFTYNIGGESLTGFNAEGKRMGKPSSFLQSLNAKNEPTETARLMTGFNRAGGKRANGLLKRHWVEGALFTGVLTADDLLELKPALFYQQKVEFYYEKGKADKDHFWSYDHSPKKIRQFKERNRNAKHNVRSII